MRTEPLVLLALVATVCACQTPTSTAPSLAHRAAEDIDPRLPVVHSAVPGQLDPALAARLAELVAAAQTGHQAFLAAAATARQAAERAGAAQSESWIAAQQALSLAVAARRPVAKALADVDAIAAARVQQQGRIGDRDFEAIQRAAAQVGAIDREQADAIDMVQRRLGN